MRALIKAHFFRDRLCKIYDVVAQARALSVSYVRLFKFNYM